MIKENFGFSSQKLFYWRKIGLIKKSEDATTGGHNRYNLQEIKTLKVIQVLQENGISTHKIRRCAEAIKTMFPEIKNPLVEKPILIFGGDVVFVHERRAYDALSGQSFLINFRDIENWAGKVIALHSKEVLPSKQLSFVSEVKIAIDKY